MAKKFKINSDEKASNRVKTKSKHYVDDAEFYQEVKDYVQACEELEKQGVDIRIPKNRPKISDSIGLKIILVCEGVMRRPNFIGYSYSDEMALDAEENAIRYLHRFDYVKYDSPYSYVGFIAWQAGVRRLQKEDKLWKTKMRYIMNAGIDDVMSELQGHDAGTVFDNDYVDFMQKIYDTKDVDLTIKKKPKKKKEVSNLEGLFDEKD